MAKVDFVAGSKRTVLNTAIADLNQTLTAIGGTAITIKDSDTAASTGVATNVVPNADGVTAYLEATNAGNADEDFDDAGGGKIQVNDNDTPGGVAVYFDEDATAVDGRLMCVSPTAGDLFVPVSSGEWVRIAHNADAATDGVLIYFDDDGATATEKMLFVSPTDTDGATSTDDTERSGVTVAGIQAISDKMDVVLAALRSAKIITT